jgi:hypothetical protein
MAATSSFSPDSLYAAWSVEERVAADRAEEEFNRNRRCQLAELVHTNAIGVLADDSLHRLGTVYGRQHQDVAAGDLPGGASRARLLEARLAAIARERDSRAALARSWLATEDGTHCYTAFVARGGLDAVFSHGAPPPSNHLAAMLDWLNWRRGGPHVLAWDATPAADEAPAGARPDRAHRRACPPDRAGAGGQPAAHAAAPRSTRSTGKTARPVRGGIDG